MSLPPVTIKIKRKRTDEPVDFLRVHESNGAESNGKRQRRSRATEFIFSRQPTESIDQTPTNLPPQSQASRPIKQPRGTIGKSTLLAGSYQSALPHEVEGQIGQDDGKAGVSGAARQNREADLLLDSANTRRFHMSRNPMANPFAPGKAQKRSATNNPTFMERKSRRLDPPVEEKSSNVKVLPDPIPFQSTQNDAPRTQKKPGLLSRNHVNAGNDTASPKPPSKPTPVGPPANVRLPNGKLMPWDVNSDLLAAEMQAYALQEIAKNINEGNKFNSVRDHHNSPTSQKSKPSKFKPKVPALRFAERHPEEAAALNQTDAMEIDDTASVEDLDDDAEYVFDTYVRMPADAMETSISPKIFGLLVLDSQPDIDEFYLDPQESDEEEEEEEEDENAENHYSADYPDDEVDSADEFDRDPYSYRNDPFEEDNIEFSDKEDDIPEWKRQIRRVQRYHGEAEDNEDE